MAYTRLLRLYYRKESPIPVGIADACRLVRAISKDQKQAVEAVLREFFELREDGWHQVRCDSEITVYQKKVEHNQRVGKLGGRPRKVETQNEPKQNPPGYFREPKQNPPQTPDPRPQTNSEAKASATDGGGKSATELTKAELWTVGKSLLAEQGMPKAQCGSFVGKLVKDYGDQVVVDAVRATVLQRPADAAEYLKATCLHAAGQRTQPESFRERDARKGRERWEEMTGEQHPDNVPKTSDQPSNILNVVEVPRLGAPA